MWLVGCGLVPRRTVGRRLLSSCQLPETITSVNSNEQFAANLQALRHARGLSQEAFAHEVGIHRTEVTKLESGGRDPKLSTVAKIARGLGVPLERLLEGVVDAAQPAS